MKSLSVFSLLFLSLPSWGQDAVVSLAPKIAEPVEVQDAVGFLPAILSAVKNGQYLLGGALVTMVLVFLAKRFVLPKARLGTGVLPILSAFLGILSGVGLAIANGAPMEAAALAVLSGPLASQLWDSIVKYFFKK